MTSGSSSTVASTIAASVGRVGQNTEADVRVVQSLLNVAGANIKVAANAWHMLGLRAEGDRFTVTFDGQKLISAQDGTFPEPGKVALWTKADSVTHFDTILITPIE